MKRLFFFFKLTWFSSKATDCGTFVIRAPPADNLKQKGDDRRLEVVTSSELEEFLEIN